MQEYNHAAFIVRYDPQVCIHAGDCVRDLPVVFNVKASPWVNVDGAKPDRIKEQVARCPSGALTFESR